MCVSFHFPAEYLSLEVGHAIEQYLQQDGILICVIHTYLTILCEVAKVNMWKGCFVQ